MKKILALDRHHEFPTDVIWVLLSPDVGFHLSPSPRRWPQSTSIWPSRSSPSASAPIPSSSPEPPNRRKNHWPGHIAREGLIVAHGVTELEAGSNVAALKTVAEAVTDNAGMVTSYKVNGNKQVITNGGMAQMYTILAKPPGGPTFFVDRARDPGLSVGTDEDKHGIRSSNTASVVLKNVVVSAANLIGCVEGQSMNRVRLYPPHGRCLRPGRRPRRHGARHRYTKQRIQFGDANGVQKAA